VQIHIRNTEIVITDGINSTPLITLNYPQIIKWTIIEKECIISLFYTKSHYNGEVKKIRLRTNEKKKAFPLFPYISTHDRYPGREGYFLLLFHKSAFFFACSLFFFCSKNLDDLVLVERLKMGAQRKK